MRQQPADQNSHYRAVSQREKREKGSENLFEEIMAEKFCTTGKETNIQIQESQESRNAGIPESSK